MTDEDLQQKEARLDELSQWIDVCNHFARIFEANLEGNPHIHGEYRGCLAKRRAYEMEYDTLATELLGLRRSRGRFY
jgi:hypothetical protein